MTLLLFALLAAAPDLTTVAERSEFTKTGRYEETQRLCQAFVQAYPRRVRCENFGTTPEQRPMVALIASDDGVLQPRAAKSKNRPVVVVQGGIHAGEIEGKDAGFAALKALLAGSDLPGVLKKVTLVFVPVFNVDGHERFGPNNRPNQRGPVEMGWRVTSQNLNLNRDYAKADAPEMQAMIRLLRSWDPILYVDLHTTDGAQFEHDVSVMLEPLVGATDALRAAAAKTRDEVMQKLEAQGHLPLRFYPSFVKTDDPTSGFAIGLAPPRFSTGYWRLHDRFSVLVETHSWKDYATRVRATRDVIAALLAATAMHGGEWLKAARDADAKTLAGTSVALTYQNVGKPKTFAFRGYAYTRERSSLSGQLWTRYDEKTPQVLNVPLMDELAPALSVTAPKAGYIVTAGFAEKVAARLNLHGFRSVKLTKPLAEVEVEAFRAIDAKPSGKTFEGRQAMTLTGEWKNERRDVPAGSLFVPLQQRWSALLVHLLEPQAPDSFGAWGDFNACFEQKEYLEDYVAEAEARLMLQANPALEAELAKLSSPEDKLHLVATKHPSWDERFNLYPVYRVDTAP
ncbi:MAG: M14 family metallopeptidase [Myxococcaceae bacterium]